MGLWFYRCEVVWLYVRRVVVCFCVSVFFGAMRCFRVIVGDCMCVDLWVCSCLCLSPFVLFVLCSVPFVSFSKRKSACMQLFSVETRGQCARVR